MSDNTEIELIGTALQNFDKIAAGFALLEKNYKGVLYDVETPLGMDHAKAARAAIREPRYEVERLRKGAKAPLLALGKRVDAEATRLTNALLVLEEPIHQQIKGEEDRIEQEKIAKAAAEAARVSAIQRAIEVIRQWPAAAVNKPSSVVAQMLMTANEYEITEQAFQERGAEAIEVLAASRAALSGIHAERLSHEAAQERLKADRLELERLRTEQNERDRLAREALAEQQAKERAITDAENARQAELLRKERADNARIARDRQDELDRQAAAQRQAQAALEAQTEALRKSQEKPVQPKGVIPSRTEILDLLAKHYQVPAKTVQKWLSMIDWESA